MKLLLLNISTTVCSPPLVEKHISTTVCSNIALIKDVNRTQEEDLTSIDKMFTCQFIMIFSNSKSQPINGI